MVTLAEAIKGADVAEESAAARELQIVGIERQAGRIQTGGGLIQQLRAGTPQRFKEIRRARKKAKRETLTATAKARTRLKEFRGQITERRSEISRVQSAIKERQKLLRDIALARKLAGRGQFPFGESKRIQKFFSQESRRLRAIEESAKREKQKKEQEITLALDLSLPAGVPLIEPKAFLEKRTTIREDVPDPRFQIDRVFPMTGADLARIVDITAEETRAGETFIPVTPEEFRRETGRPSRDITLPPPISAEFSALGVPSFAQLTSPRVDFIDLAPRQADLLGAPDIQDVQERDLTGLEKFGARFFKETRMDEPRIFGLPKRTEVPSLLALSSIFAQEISKGVAAPSFAKAGRRPTGIFDITIPKLTKQEQATRELVTGFGGRVLSISIPQTPETIAITAAVPPVLGAIPSAIGRIGLGAFAGFETFEAFRPGLTVEERTAAGLGAGLAVGGIAALPSKIQLGQRGQRAQIEALFEKDIISKETTTALLQGVKLQKFLRGAPEPKIVKGIGDIIPKEISLEQRAIVEQFLLGKKPEVFGGKSLELRDIRAGSDIDVALKENRRALRGIIKDLKDVGKVTVSGEAIGVETGKLFDIKDIARIKDFPLRQRPVKTTEKIPTPRISEQFARSLSGTIGFGGKFLRKPKDFPDVLLTGRALLGEARGQLQDTRLPGLSLLRQARLAKAEQRFIALEKAQPEIERLTGLDVTIDPFKTTTARPGLSDVAKEIEKAFPTGKKARIGGLTLEEIGGKPPRRVGVKPESLRDLSSQFDFSGFKTPKPSVFSFPSLFRGRGFAPSDFAAFKPPREPPSIFEPPRKRRRFPPPPPPPPPSEFKPPPPTDESFGFPAPPRLPPFKMPPFEPPPRKPPFRKRIDGRRKLVKRKIKQRRRKGFTIRPSFEASAFRLFGRFPKTTIIRGADIGILPSKRRFIPKRFAPKRKIKIRKKRR